LTAGLKVWDLLKKNALRYPCSARVKKMFYARVRRVVKVKGKDIPITGRGGP
jgi:hypothetical protein